MNTSPTTTTCPLEKENDTEMVSPPGSELTSISLDASEEANDADASAVDASLKAKTMKEALLSLRYGRGFAVSVVIALAGKGFVSRAYNDPLGTDDMMMNADLGIDSSKQVALLDEDWDGKDVANYDFTKVDGGVRSGGMPSERSLKEPISYTFTKVVGDGVGKDSNGGSYDFIKYIGVVTTLDECKTKCEDCPGQGQANNAELRGISFSASPALSGVTCECHVENNGSVFDTSVCTGASQAFSSHLGTGPICQVIPFTVPYESWRVDSNLQCPTSAPTSAPTAFVPTSAPTNANAKAGKVAKVPKANGIADLQVQEMKSGGSSISISISPHVGILTLIVASRNLYLLL